MALSDLAVMPEIHVSAEVLQRIFLKYWQYVQEAEIVLSEDHDDIGHGTCTDPPGRVGSVCFHHAILKIVAPGVGTVIYRVNSYDPKTDTWTAAWPD